MTLTPFLKRLKPLAASAAMVSIVFIALPAYATWTSWEYRNSEGEYRYGIKNGKDFIKLGQKKRKRADKAASEMNDVDKGVMLSPDGQGDYRPGLELPK